MKLHRLLLIAVLVVSSSLFAAERRTIPTLTATDAGGATALALTRATIRVTIRGPLARTELQLTYRNDLDRELSGDFFFPLPPNAEVSDLGLYFDGHLRHAVAVERVLAKQAYDEVSHRGVDPALAEYNAGRGFRFRVYPIPAEGEKQVFLAYDEELGTSDYRLDLRYGRTIDTDITIDAEGRAVTIEGSVPRSHATQLLDGTIRIAGANEERALAARAADGTWYAAAALAVDAHAAELPPAPEVTVVWDTSSSSVQQNGKALREFLNGFLEQQLGSANVNVVPFHVAVEAPRRIAKNALTRTLDDLQPLGATNLIDLAHRLPQLAATLPPNGRLILVTDGLTSFGDSRDVAAAFTKLDALHVPLLIVNASNSADDALLTNAASAARGWYVDLTHTDVQTAIETAMHLPAAARLKSSAASLLPSAVVATANEAIVAAARASTPIVALPISITTANGTTTRELPVTELRAPVEVSMVQRTWARARLRELIARGADDGEIIAHGRKFNQLTPRTSLLVLDSWRDYELYDIPMPEDVAAEKERASLDRESPPFFTTSTNVTPQPPAGSWFIKGRVTESGAPLPGATVTMRDGERILATQVSDSDGRWWIAFATPPQSFRLVAELEGFQSSSVAFNEPVPSGAAIELTLRLSAVSESITVTAAGPAYQDDAAGVDSPPPVPSLQTPLQSTDELLNAIARETIDEDDEGDEALAATVAAKRHELRGRVLERMRGMTSPTERLRYYLTARAVLGGDKGFHFLAAQSMHDLAPDLAVRMLTDLAEARNADAPMLRLLARLLDSWDEPSLARLLLQRAIELAPNEPQSVREMLLLEARAGRPAHVDSWRTRLNATSKKQRDEWGMKELFEQTDEMLARWQKTSWLDRQRGVDLRDGGEDVDVLVELMFDTGWSWVDIHVKEPGGEIVKWDHTESAAGATFTGGYIFGYGPEIYSIRNAPHGTYQIDLDYYASDRVNPSLETLAHVIVYKRTSRGHTERKDYFMVLTDDTEHRELAKVEY